MFAHQTKHCFNVLWQNCYSKIFLECFGINGLYKDIGLGVVKLLFCWLTLGIWWLVDLFLVCQGIKNHNIAKIAQAIAFAKKK
ncbi:hypothetical protein ACWIWK_01335 [Helicobacter sp. 23-1048]